MKKLIRLSAITLSCALFLWATPDMQAQGNGKNKQKSAKIKTHGNSQGKGKGNAKSFPHATPHTVKVPPGHYPPPGMCRLWYPGRPPGHQPAAVPCNQLIGVPLTDGAFILHGDRAYDSQYDWRKEEVKKPKSVPRQIIDILFPNLPVPDNTNLPN